ncbi:MFS transporter [Marinicauda pacifica]|nr:MFS transporter [Marinicauda pacifica]
MRRGVLAEIMPAPSPYDPSKPSSPDVRRRAFRLLFLCLVATGVGNSMLFAILPPLARDLEVAEVWVGAIYTLSALMFLTMSPVWGALSDRYGRRPMIVFGLSAFSVSTLVFAAGAFAGQAGWLPPLAAIVAMALARTLFGALGSATNPSAQAYVADRTLPAERTAALAGLTSAFGIGGAIGPALAAAFADRIGIVPFMVAVAVIVAFAALAVRLTLPERTPPKEQRRAINPLIQFRFAGDPRLTAFMVYGAAAWLAQAGSLQALAFYVMDRLGEDPQSGLQLAGVALTGGATAIILAQLVVIPYFKMSPRTLMIAGSVLCLVGNLELVIASSYGTIVFGFLLTSFGFGLSRSGFTGGASLAVSPAEQGRAAGLTTATAGVGFLIAPVTGLWLYQVFGPATPFRLNVALAVAAVLVAALHPRIRAAVSPVEGDDPDRPSPV